MRCPRCDGTSLVTAGGESVDCPDCFGTGFARPVTGLTLDEMREALENISAECRGTAAVELKGPDANRVAVMLVTIAYHVEKAHSLVVRLMTGKE